MKKISLKEMLPLFSSYVTIEFRKGCAPDVAGYLKPLLVIRVIDMLSESIENDRIDYSKYWVSLIGHREDRIVLYICEYDSED